MMEFFILCSLTPPQAAGNALAGIQCSNVNKVTYQFATFVRSGYRTAQEVKTDLLFFFGTSQNLTLSCPTVMRFCSPVV